MADTKTKKYDLEKRTEEFAKLVRKYLLSIPKNVVAMEDARQLARSSGSVGANYIEAQDPISKKDAFLRMRICRKEAKESAYWLRIFEVHNHPAELEVKRTVLLAEAQELTKIFGAIVNKLRMIEEGGKE